MNIISMGFEIFLKANNDNVLMIFMFQPKIYKYINMGLKFPQKQGVINVHPFSRKLFIVIKKHGLKISKEHC